MIYYNGIIRFEGFLKRHVGLLHPNHYLFTSAKHSLSQLYGRDECYLLNTLSSEQLERKISICRDLLAVADVIEPGLARLRGTVIITPIVSDIIRANHHQHNSFRMTQV